MKPLPEHEVMQRLATLAEKSPDAPDTFKCWNCQDLGYVLEVGGEHEYVDCYGDVKTHKDSTTMWSRECDACERGRTYSAGARKLAKEREWRKRKAEQRRKRRDMLMEAELDHLRGEKEKDDDDIPF